MQTRRCLILAVVMMGSLPGNSCTGNEAGAVRKWMQFLPGKWEFQDVENDVSGVFVVAKTPLDHVLRVEAIHSDNRVFVVSMYVWNEEGQTLQLLGGYKTADDQGAFLVTFNKFAEKQLWGKDSNGETVGYKKIDGREWHVTNVEGQATIKLRRKKSQDRVTSDHGQN